MHNASFRGLKRRRVREVSAGNRGLVLTVQKSRSFPLVVSAKLRSNRKKLLATFREDTSSTNLEAPYRAQACNQ